MTGGYAGKILKVNLTNRTTSTINTSDYEEYGGGYGIATAIFWDMCADKLPMDAYDPDNVISFMSSPLSGTLTPGEAGRTEVTGIGPQSSPIWYTRTNFGGRFAGQLKLAGWDGVVVTGASSDPVWLKIVNDTVTFEDASTLWGLDTWTAQQNIWQMQSGNSGAGEWEAAGDGYTTQRPAVACIGPIGEIGSNFGSIIHDAGNGAGQGGLGGVLGSKKLKAISVIGTGAISVANPQALYDARKWITHVPPDGPRTVLGPLSLGMSKGAPGAGTGPRGCMGCPWPCRIRFLKQEGNESQCFEGTAASADIVQKWGGNQCEIQMGIAYLKNLNNMGVLGSGKAINSHIPFELASLSGYRSLDAKIYEYIFDSIFNGTDIGPDLYDGFYRAAAKWGRASDMQDGTASFPYWGCPEHGYEPRTELTWGYGSILGERDINEHGYNTLVYWYSIYGGIDPPVPVQEVVEISTNRMVPFEGDPYMFDFSDDNMYSIHLAKATAWQSYYSRSFKQSLGFCDWCWPNLCDGNHPDNEGMTPEAEPMFYNAVTGKNVTFADTMLGMGRKVLNLCNAIWILQGRHRDMVKYADYIYDSGTAGFGGLTGPYYPVSMYIDGEWLYQDAYGRNIDRTGFEELKTNYYELMEWDTSNGWPTRTTLEGLDLGFVADKLEAAGKLGT